ncbi:MAG: type II toxin-antitoxin system VapC family toxin [Candidatus Bathyarchaeia archaeon]
MVDSSALIAFFLREEGWRSIAKYIIQTISVDLALKEFYNALWKSVNIRKHISLDDAKILNLFQSYIEKNMLIESEIKYLDKAFKIALDHNITVYDALYVAQALQHGKPLLTLDQTQREVARKLEINAIP